MCGIAGYTGPAVPGLLGRMNTAQAHRGPDGAGEWSGGPGGRAVVHLGHRRLAVIDPAGGVQPMATDDQACAVTFNGEIYGFAALRAGLESEGDRFRTRSDTEVLLAGLARHGEDFIARLDGMFAFAFLDARRGRLLLAIDRFGQKPLTFGTTREGCLVFASELGAVRRHPGLPDALSPAAVLRTLAFDAPPAPSTIVGSVRRMEPGTAAAFDVGPDGVVRHVRTWRWAPLFPPPAETPRARASDTDVRDALRASVRSHLVSDVPLGILLSGGIDSTCVAWAASLERPVRTLSLGFDDPAFDESDTAARTARALGTEHVVLRMPGGAAADTLDAVVAALDEPLADAGCLPAWELFRAARAEATVVLGGDGGDELLEGYPTFRALELIRRFPLAGVPPVPQALCGISALFPIPEGYYPRGYQIRRLGLALGADWWWRALTMFGACSPADVRRLARPETVRAAGLPDGPADFARALVEDACPPEMREACARANPADADIAAHLRNYMATQVLRKVDRMSMAHGLEVRAPLLGDPFASLCLSLDPAIRRRGGVGKAPLRRLVASGPASHAAHLPKRGFAIPVARWLRTEFRPAAGAMFEAADSPLGEWFAMDRVGEMWRAHRDRRRDHRRELWALLVLGRWVLRHGAKPA